MKRSIALVAFLFFPACANWIKESDAVILDVVEGTDRVSLDEERVEGAVARIKVRFLCTKRLYAVTNVYETPYEPEHEAYEIPIGVITFIPSALWYAIAEIFTGGAAPDEKSGGPLFWSVAGLNPFLNVENGMFFERYRIRQKEGSKRPQESSRPEPFDAVVEPKGGELKVAWVDGEAVVVNVPKEVLITLNLIEVARVIPSPTTQRLDVSLSFSWDDAREAHVEPPPPQTKKVNVYIDAALAQKLYSIKEASRTLFEATTQEERDQALKTITEAGFSREAAMVRDRLPALKAAPVPKT